MNSSAKLLTGLLAVTAGLSLASTPTTAQAKSHARHYKSVKVLKKTTTKKRYVKVTASKKTKAYIYKDMHLKKIQTSLHNYTKGTGVTTYKVKLRLKSGKVVNYTRVRNLTNKYGVKTTGYLRSSYLKTTKAPKKTATTSKPTTSTTSSTKTNKPTTATKPVKQGNPNLGYHVKITADGLNYDRSNADVQPESAYTTAKYADEMLYEINEVRKDNGLSSLQLDGFLTQVATQRAEQEAASVRAGNGFGHYTADKKVKADIVAQQLNPSFNHLLAECIGSGNFSTKKIDDSGDYSGINPYDVANSDFYEYVFDDGMSNNGHRNIILSSRHTKIGIGTAITTNPESGSQEIINALNFY